MAELAENILREIQETAVARKDDAITHHEDLVASIQGSTLSIEDIGTKVKDAAEAEAIAIATRDEQTTAKAAADRESDLANRNILEKTYIALRSGFVELGSSIKSDFSMLMGPLSALGAMPGMKTIISLLKIVGMWLAKLFLHLITKKLFSGLREVDASGSLDVKETVDNFKKWGKSLIFGKKADTPDRLSKEDRAAKVGKEKLKAGSKKAVPKSDKAEPQDDAIPKWNLLQRWRARQMRNRAKEVLKNQLLLNFETKKGSAASFVQRMAMRRLWISQLFTAKGFMAHVKRMRAATALFTLGSIALVGTIIMFSIKAIALGAIFLLIGLAILALIAVVIWGAMWLYKNSKIFRALVDTVVDYFMAIVSSIGDIFGGFYNFFAGLFTGDFDRMFGGLKDVFRGFWDLILAPFRAISSFIKDVFGIDISKWLTDKLKEWLPNWALKLLGLGGDSTAMSILPAKPTEEAVAWNTKNRNITGDIQGGQDLATRQAALDDRRAKYDAAGMEQPSGDTNQQNIVVNQSTTRKHISTTTDPTDMYAGNAALAQ